jgi:hypothetical protein
MDESLYRLSWQKGDELDVLGVESRIGRYWGIAYTRPCHSREIKDAYDPETDQDASNTSEEVISIGTREKEDK